MKLKRKKLKEEKTVKVSDTTMMGKGRMPVTKKIKAYLSSLN